ncbi:MAG: SCO1664 family protein [Actinomycetota bacterium]
MSVSDEQARALLSEGEIEIQGLFTDASNYTFAVVVAREDERATAVYKPQRGERTLWDFPVGTLHLREVAAYEVSRALGWDIVPPTVVRDGPHGPGSMQLFVEADPQEQYFTLMPARAAEFRVVAAFDVVVNNADRKAGHCLLESGGTRLWAIDHGVCFHADPKLRTVIWDFAGESLPGSVVLDLERFVAMREGGDCLAQLLSPEEIDAVYARASALLAAGTFPDPPADRRPYPWPPV